MIDRGLSTKALAAAAGTTTRTLQRYINRDPRLRPGGTRALSNPDFWERLERLADALGCEVVDFLVDGARPRLRPGGSAGAARDGTPTIVAEGDGGELGGSWADALAVRWIRQESALARRDASPRLGWSSRREAPVYVERLEAQRWLLKKIRASADPQPLVVVGAAGIGKTTLLWWLANAVAQVARMEPWFVRAPLLLGSIAPGVSPLERITEALQAAHEAPGRIVVLLDTADLLLHDSASSTLLKEALLRMQEAGVLVVVTCRPDEAAALPWRAPHRFDLGPFDHQRRDAERGGRTELEEAIERLAQASYEVGWAASDACASVLGAVARGQPIREVAASPIALRMLFEVYAPGPVATEINTLSLYGIYWEHRVAADLRQGSPIHGQRGGDLSAAAEALGLVLLTEGRTEVEWTLLRRRGQELYRAWGLNRPIASDLEALVGRGVLALFGQQQRPGFFHQTFLEYAAALGVIRLGAESRAPAWAIEQMGSRYEQRPADLFLRSIFEKCLVLAAESAPQARAAEAWIRRLLQTRHPLAVDAGIYAFVHHHGPDSDTREDLSEALAQGSVDRFKGFLTQAPNLPRHRWAEILPDLERGWRDRQWDARCAILQGLSVAVTVAEGGPRLVRDFLDHQGVLAYATDPSQGKPGSQPRAEQLCELLQILAPHEPAHSWRWLMALMRHGLEDRSGTQVEHAALKAIVSAASSFDPSTIADRVSEQLCSAPPEAQPSSLDARLLFGRLWAIQWKHQGIRASAVWQQLDPAQPLLFYAQLNGLARLLRDGPPAVVDAALSHWTALSESRISADWVTVVWSQLLAEAGEDGTRGTGSETVSQVRRFALERIREGRRSPDNLVASEWCRALNAAPLPTAELAGLLKGMPFGSWRWWVATEARAGLAARAASGGHRVATDVLARIQGDAVAAPQGYPRIVAATLGGEARRGSHRALLLLASFLAALPDDQVGRSSLLAALAEVAVAAAELEPITVALLSLWRRWVGGSNPAVRMDAVRLESELVRLGLAAPRDLTELANALAGTGDPKLQWHLAALMVAIAVERPQAEALNALLPLSLSTDLPADVRDQALTAASRCGSVARTTEELETVVSAALGAPVSTSRLFDALWTARHAVELSPERGVAMLETVLVSRTWYELAGRGLRKLATVAAGPVSGCLGAVGPPLRRRLLDRTREMEPHAAVILIKAAGGWHLDEVVAQLDALVEDPEVDHRVRKTIATLKKHRQQPLGGERWPELLESWHRAQARR